MKEIPAVLHAVTKRWEKKTGSKCWMERENSVCTQNEIVLTHKN